MLTFNDDGSFDIDFPQGVVHVRPPTFGGMKRLRSERVRLDRAADDTVLGWDAANPSPSEDDAVATARHATDRAAFNEETRIAATAAWWKLVLVGDNSFKGLADGDVPDDVDDWPAGLLYDIRPVIPANATIEVLLSAQSMPDQVFRWWGKARSRSGSTNGAAQTTTP